MNLNAVFTLALPACILFTVQTESLPVQVTAAPKFEVASVKPSPPNAQSGALGCHGADVSSAPKTTIPTGRCVFRHQTLTNIINFAYPLDPHLWTEPQIVGGPPWINSTFFQVEAEAGDPSTATLDQLREMVRTLLKERFQLAFHMETRKISGYYMVPAKEGFKLKEASGPPTGVDLSAIRKPGNRSTTVFFQPLTDFAGFLSLVTHMPIVDKTGIQGKYNYVLDAAELGDDLAPSIFTALQEQLGLKLEAQKVPFDFIVIDRAEKPPDEGRKR